MWARMPEQQSISFPSSRGLQNILDCNKTELFWKKMPKMIYIRAEEKERPDHKPIKDHLTLLFCTKATEDFKVTSLLLYQSENLCDFKKFKVQKSQLNIMWKTNSKAWMTQTRLWSGSKWNSLSLHKEISFEEEFTTQSVLAHPENIEDNLLEEFKFIKGEVRQFV